MKKLLILILVFCYYNNINGQIIELKEVYIDCNQYIQNDTILYEPYSISFTFYAINNTQSDLSFGTCNPYAGGKRQFGYFEIVFNKKKKNDLKSLNLNEQFCLSGNNKIRVITELREKDYSIRGYSFSEIYNLVFNSRMFYRCIERDYDVEKCSKSKFNSQEVVKNDYLILFCYNGKVIHAYPVNLNSSESIDNDSKKGL
ncbi:MAG: hypothetical protein LBQ60_16100 [Bacteroidales bacterium]|jgi:hypothetical protein|nr:hypothetical protein [Bacteroidales bacterium]